MEKFTSYSEEQTKKIAKKIASFLHKKDIIILSGDLGSGKTKFTEGFLSYFEIENEISSPTFTIVNEYETHKQKIYHFDLYRLSDIDEFFAIGGEEYLENGICLIEWGEMLETFIPNRYLKISFERNFEDDNIRILTFEPHGDFPFNFNMLGV